MTALLHTFVGGTAGMWNASVNCPPYVSVRRAAPMSAQCGPAWAAATADRVGEVLVMVALSPVNGRRAKSVTNAHPSGQ